MARPTTTTAAITAAYVDQPRCRRTQIKKKQRQRQQPSQNKSFRLLSFESNYSSRRKFDELKASLFSSRHC